LRHSLYPPVVVLSSLTILVTACGSSNSPTAPTANPSGPMTPTAVPPSRLTVSIDVPSDNFGLTNTLAKLSSGESAEVLFRPVRINTVTGESFGHSIVFWLFPSPDVRLDTPSPPGIALGFGWNQRDDWVVVSRVPGAVFQTSGRHVTLALSQQQTVRIARRTDGSTELFLNGESLLTVPNPAFEYLLGQVVGAAADFSYVPPSAATAIPLVTSP